MHDKLSENMKSCLCPQIGKHDCTSLIQSIASEFAGDILCLQRNSAQVLSHHNSVLPKARYQQLLFFNNILATQIAICCYMFTQT